MDYISTAQAAKMWGISQRRVQALCKDKRIPDVKTIGNMFLIPENAIKPEDPRKSRIKS